MGAGGSKGPVLRRAPSCAQAISQSAVTATSPNLCPCDVLVGQHCSCAHNILRTLRVLLQEHKQEGDNIGEEQHAPATSRAKQQPPPTTVLQNRCRDVLSW